MNLTQEQVKELFLYDPETGLLRWRTTQNKNRIAGSVAGRKHRGEYISLKMNGAGYLAHRLAWIYMHGTDPKMIDHINGDKADNRIVNLRPCSTQQNAQNLRRAHSDSTTGILGVSMQRNKFRAAIRANGKCLFLGLFNTAKEAQDAYLEKKRKLHDYCTI